MFEFFHFFWLLGCEFHHNVIFDCCACICQLYRDCLRLVRYVAPGTSKKNIALSRIVRQEFAKNRDVTDETQIQTLQANAIRALSNYLVFSSSNQDPKVTQAVKSFHDRHVQSLAREDEHQQQQQRKSIEGEANTTTSTNSSGGK